MAGSAFADSGGRAPDVQYIYRIARVSRLLGERLDATCARFDITRSQFEAIAVLRRHHAEPLSAQQIMAASLLTSGSVTAMINRMLRAGLVERIADNTRLARMLPAAERREMNALMRRFLGAMEALPGNGAS